MNAEHVFRALDLPPAAWVGKRVPKSLLLENGAATAADRKAIQDGVEMMEWLASLKPGNAGVPAFRDDTRTYDEVAVVRVDLRERARRDRLTELVHRAIPYPVVVLASEGSAVRVSMANKRNSQAQSDAVVLDGEVLAADVPADGDPLHAPFRDALGLPRQRRDSMWTLYAGWMEVLQALLAGAYTGTLVVPADEAARAVRRDAMLECARLDAELARLRMAAAHEVQMVRRVELNAELKRAEAAHAAAVKRL